MLVVEDHDDSRTLLATLLAIYGAQVTAAATVQEAIESFERISPDVLVSDINMPDEDGFALIERVRAIGPEGGGNVPAVAVTALDTEADRDSILAAGFQAYIAKPIEIEELVRVIKELLGRA